MNKIFRKWGLILNIIFLLSGSYLWAKMNCFNTLEEALSLALKENKNIALNVSAKWCPYCQKLDQEIYQTQIGEKLFKNLICVNVDFDTKYGQEMKKKFRVIGLPTIIFLSPQGKEIDRIIGYSEKNHFINLAKKYARGEDSLPALQKKLEQEPENLRLLFEVGEKILLRGEEKKGIELLAKILAMDPDNSSGFSDNALFILGRYYSRVKEEPKKGLEYWQRLFLKYPHSDYGQGALSWMLKAYKDLNKLDKAYSFLKQQIESSPDNSYLYFSMAYFCLKYKENLKEALTYAQQGLELGPENVPLLELLAEIYKNSKMYSEAIETLNKAVKLKPEDENLKNKLEELIKLEKQKL
ncbi:MAG: tetratricopeptide repeat protein [Candidatus Aminicenantia bacterium]